MEQKVGKNNLETKTTSLNDKLQVHLCEFMRNKIPFLHYSRQLRLHLGKTGLWALEIILNGANTRCWLAGYGLQLRLKVLSLRLQLAD